MGHGGVTLSSPSNVTGGLLLLLLLFFLLLGGLVLDAGAVFQHAALVAREYGIPAVIMTRDATTVILDGQTVTIDASQGVVELAPSTQAGG